MERRFLRFLMVASVLFFGYILLLRSALSAAAADRLPAGRKRRRGPPARKRGPQPPRCPKSPRQARHPETAGRRKTAGDRCQAATGSPGTVGHARIGRARPRPKPLPHARDADHEGRGPTAARAQQPALPRRGRAFRLSGPSLRAVPCGRRRLSGRGGRPRHAGRRGGAEARRRDQGPRRPIPVRSPKSLDKVLEGRGPIRPSG